MPEPLLRAQELYKSFGRRKVLRGASFSVYPGSLVGVVGEWYYVGYLFTTDDLIGFKFRVTNTFLQVDGRHLTFLTLGLNAITLIVGFMLFNSTRKDTQFDHRLVLNGYPQPLLILAKLTSLVAVAAAVSLYASAVMYAYWQPYSPALVRLGFFCAALCYGGLGLLLGVLVRGELEGFFLIIMISLIDTFIQNPIGNPVASKDIVKAFPAYAPTQITVAGGFTHVMPWLYMLFSLVWLVGFALLGLAVFIWKTHAWNVHVTLPSEAAMPSPTDFASQESDHSRA